MGSMMRGATSGNQAAYNGNQQKEYGNECVSKRVGGRNSVEDRP